jgi:hypothetical protein
MTVEWSTSFISVNFQELFVWSSKKVSTLRKVRNAKFKYFQLLDAQTGNVMLNILLDF